jgi:hypothetical protein
MALPSEEEDDAGLAALTSFSPRGALGFFAAGAFLAWAGSGGNPCQIGRDTAVVLGSGRAVRGARARTLGAAATFSLIATISATSAMMRGDGYRRADGRVAGSRRGFGERAR